MAKRKVGGVAIEKRDPELASKALVALADTGSMRQAAKTVGVAIGTVGAIADRNPEEFGRIKQERARQHFEIANRCLQVLATKDLTEVAPVSLSIMSGIHTDKAIGLTAKEIPTGLNVEDMRKVVGAYDYYQEEIKRRGLSVVEPIKEKPHEETTKNEQENKTETGESQAEQS